MAAGKVFIITNASDGWVQHSATMCMPGLSKPLKQIEVISARAGFENAFPGDSHAWKMHSFLQVQNKLQMEAVTNLISVGDSHIEMDAVHLLGRSFAHALVKTVKLWERPTPYELVGTSSMHAPYACKTRSLWVWETDQTVGGCEGEVT